ncbi:hypothetical protein HF568_00785 [Acidithiobacillus ferridurans]|uniref:Uncharacterized protein n=2 Tax=Acidithiobacillus ferridurans TaxID=1232575 RepID=A0A8X8K965_ACIFI|nr:hypothetical protein [Acidithiobacillus ferridurans]
MGHLIFFCGNTGKDGRNLVALGHRIPCVGLFGTCGASTWRSAFIARYQSEDIRYFNPQVADWRPEYADIEAQHLARDEIILFPVTGETYGFGSLAETGFSILQALQADPIRNIILMVDEVLNHELESDALAFQESLRARRLVNAHIRQLNRANVFIVQDLAEMLRLSVELYRFSTDVIEGQQKHRNWKRSNNVG